MAGFRCINCGKESKVESDVPKLLYLPLMLLFLVPLSGKVCPKCAGIFIFFGALAMMALVIGGVVILAVWLGG